MDIKSSMKHLKILVTGSFLFLLICVFFLNVPSDLSASSHELKRFFRMGDGRLSIRNEVNGREADVKLFGHDGTFNEASLREIDAVFNFPNNARNHVALRLLFLLDYFTDRVAPGKTIHIVSGYRSPSYNEQLKKSGKNVAKTSAHIDGMALDFFIEGVDGKQLWEMIRTENCCGVGHYGGKVVHLDSGKPRFWEAATSKTDTQESEFNRRVYLTTEYDRYKQKETIRLSLTSVSDFNFGIRKTATLLGNPEGQNKSIDITTQANSSDECIFIDNRDVSKSIYTALPIETKHGRYRVRIDFCKKPFGLMPDMVVSNEIEVVRE